MDFLIRKNSTSPYLVMRLVFDNESDYDVINNKLANAKVTFSMINVETGNLKVANRGGFVYSKEKVIDAPYNEYEHYIYYKWREKDTNEVGVFKGEFKLNFLEDCDTMILPIKEDLYIHIKDSITKTTVINN